MRTPLLLLLFAGCQTPRYVLTSVDPLPAFTTTTAAHCRGWETTREWVGEPTPGAEALVRTRCLPVEKEAPPTDGRVDARPADHFLSEFIFDEPGTVLLRDGGKLTNVVKVSFYSNVIVVRLRDGTGLLVSPERFLGTN